MGHALASRQLVDGSGTVITLYRDERTLHVEAVNRNGRSERQADPAESLFITTTCSTIRFWIVTGPPRER